MNSSNPFAMMMNMMNQGMPNMGGAPSMGPMNPMNNGINPMAQMMSMMQNRNQKPQQIIPLNQTQFKQYVSNIDDNVLQQLVQQARQQGISDNDIEAGINFIKQLK